MRDLLATKDKLRRERSESTVCALSQAVDGHFEVLGFISREESAVSKISATSCACVGVCVRKVTLSRALQQCLALSRAFAACLANVTYYGFHHKVK